MVIMSASCCLCSCSAKVLTPDNLPVVQESSSRSSSKALGTNWVHLCDTLGCCIYTVKWTHSSGYCTVQAFRQLPSTCFVVATDPTRRCASLWSGEKWVFILIWGGERKSFRRFFKPAEQSIFLYGGLHLQGLQLPHLFATPARILAGCP